MCGFRLARGAEEPGTVSEALMVKEAHGIGLALGIALDRCGAVSCNHKLWPSCIHANPEWDRVPPGGEQTVRGKVYYLRGTKEDVLERYRRDFGRAE